MVDLILNATWNESCDEIQQFIDGLSQDQFSESKLVRSAVVQKLMVIGEVPVSDPGLPKRHQSHVV